MGTLCFIVHVLFVCCQFQALLSLSTVLSYLLRTRSHRACSRVMPSYADVAIGCVTSPEITRAIIGTRERFMVQSPGKTHVQDSLHEFTSSCKAASQLHRDARMQRTQRHAPIGRHEGLNMEIIESKTRSNQLLLTTPVP